MRKVVEIIILISVHFVGYNQCEKKQITYVNPLGMEIDSVQSYLTFVLNQKTDSVRLELLYDSNLTNYVLGVFFTKVNAISDSTNLLKKDNQINTCVICFKKNIKIIDSIDINNDGFKELFIFRKWRCTAPYNHSIPYNDHLQRQNYGQYEVWDVKSKEMIFKITSIFESRIPITVNVMETVGYRSKVTINNKGSIYVTTPRSGTKFDAEIKNGTYTYNLKTRNYEKE